MHRILVWYHLDQTELGGKVVSYPEKIIEAESIDEAFYKYRELMKITRYGITYEEYLREDLFLRDLGLYYRILEKDELKQTNRMTTQENKNYIQDSLNFMRDLCHNNAVQSGWTTNIKTGEKFVRNKGEMLCLVHSEISEAMEGERKDLFDDHLPHRKMAEVELADALIRIFDYAGEHGYDLGGAVVEKMEYNKNRADHKLENRIKDGGKNF